MANEKLKNMIDHYEELFNNPTDDNYASLMAVMQVLQKKRKELKEKTEEFYEYLNRRYKGSVTCAHFVDNYHDHSFDFYCRGLNLRGYGWKEKAGQRAICFFKIMHNAEIWFRKNVYEMDLRVKSIYEDIRSDAKIDEYVKYYKDYLDNIGGRSPGGKNTGNYSLHDDLKTQLGLFVHLLVGEDTLKLLITDKKHFPSLPKHSSEFRAIQYPDAFLHYIPYGGGLSFTNEDDVWYFRDFLTNEREMGYSGEEVKKIINEPLMANIYCGLKVDISHFGRELQKEIKSYEKSGLIAINELKTSEEAEFQKLQTERIMQAYQLFKQLAELLNNAQTDLQNIKKVHIDGLEKLMFKNTGHPTGNGYIEFDDFFRDNMVLRMLDLSGISLENVDIRGMDFSGTNIHINPQKIYNKDMTGVNATGVNFSPFSDSFDDVVLDGAIITDYQAAIHLDKLRSYDDNTVVPNNRQKGSK